MGKENKGKLILSLCGGTGSWEKPYVEAGYTVCNITLPEYDVRRFHDPGDVYGILAAPPCTEFSVAGTRWWKTKPPELLVKALEVVYACLRIIEEATPVWWALENPAGRLPKYIGEWRYTFQPWEYGDPWTKRTCIWGDHNMPIKSPVEPVGTWMGSNAGGKPLGIVDHPEFLPPAKKLAQIKLRADQWADRATLRSITPPGFARAFYEANR